MADTIAAATKVLDVWLALAGHTITGLSNNEISKATGQPAPNVTRALNTLIDRGLVSKLDNGRFAHSVRTLGIAQAHADHIARLSGRINETAGRITAIAAQHTKD